jgi:hypothetical protein
MKHNTWKLLESAVFETLEHRQMMSASALPGISLNNGTLSLNGDATKPTAMVVDYTADKSELYSRIGDVIRYFPTSQVKNIDVNAGNGNDYIYVVPTLKVDANITAGSGNDSIHAGGGNASITAGNGNDVIFTAKGNNTIHLGNGNSRVLGDNGNDSIVVGTGDNYIYGGAGDDSITAGSGDNTLVGASGNDKIVAGNGNNYITGGLGNDNIKAGTGRDSLIGNNGNDNLTGGGTGSVVTGGYGTNVVNGAPTSTKTGGATVSSSNPTGATNSGGAASTGTTGTGSSGTGTTSKGTTGSGGTTTGGVTPTGGTGAGTTPVNTGTGGTAPIVAGTGGSVNQPVTNPHAKAPTPVLNLLAGEREVGLGINVDGLQSKLAMGTAITTSYQWDFGDPGTQFNTMSGFAAAHVYDTPGTYTIKLTVTDQDGGSASVSQSVTIAASSRKQIFVDSVNGSDSNAGTQVAPIKTLVQAATMLGDNTEILLHAGEKFDVSIALHINSHNVLIGKYGTGANPILNRIKENGSNTMATYSGANGVTFENLTFDSPYGVGANSQAPKTGVEGINLAGSNIVIRNCTFLNVDDAINENGNPTGVLIQGNNAPLANGLRGYFVWGQGSRSVILGNNAANSTREHIVREVNMVESTIENNTFANLDRTSIDPYDTSKGAIEIHVGSYAYIADNKITDGDIRLGPLGLFGEAASDSTEWDVITDNQLSGTQIYLNSGTHHAMVDNNVVTNNTGDAMDISGPDSQGRTTADVTIVDNTALDNGTSGNFLRVGGYVDGITLTNNLWVAPNIHTGESAVNIYASDLNSFTTIGENIWPSQATNATEAGAQSATQWDANKQVHNDIFKTVELSDTYQTTLGTLKAGSSLARAA